MPCREKPRDGGRGISGRQAPKRRLQIGHGTRRHAEKVAREHHLLDAPLRARAEPDIGLDQPARGPPGARENVRRGGRSGPLDERGGADFLAQELVGKLCLERGYRSRRRVQIEPLRESPKQRGFERRELRGCCLRPVRAASGVDRLGLARTENFGCPTGRPGY
jgi:hypothetical protein